MSVVPSLVVLTPGRRTGLDRFDTDAWPVADALSSGRRTVDRNLVAGVGFEPT
jgi:hypothetical protein